MEVNIISLQFWSERACIFDMDKISKVSQIIETELQNIEKFYNGVKLESYVIMPNHIHAIVVINDKIKTNLSQIISTFKSITYKKVKQSVDVVTEDSSLPPSDNIEVKTKSGDLGVAVTVRDLIQNHNSIWHKSYHDHIIRDECELFAIRKYINDNPVS